VLKITDYGIPDIRSRQARYMGPDNEDKKFRGIQFLPVITGPREDLYWTYKENCLQLH
jgi:hypothetical protein